MVKLLFNGRLIGALSASSLVPLGVTLFKIIKKNI